MSHSSSKHLVHATRRPRTPADHTGTTEFPAGPEVPANKQSATGRRGYLQWAGFAAGTRDEVFGFGAYFVDDEPSASSAQSGSRMTRYTWTPSGRG
jgi:hypothetical protein